MTEWKFFGPLKISLFDKDIGGYFLDGIPLKEDIKLYTYLAYNYNLFGTVVLAGYRFPLDDFVVWSKLNTDYCAFTGHIVLSDKSIWELSVCIPNDFTNSFSGIVFYAHLNNSPCTITASNVSQMNRIIQNVTALKEHDLSWNDIKLIYPGEDESVWFKGNLSIDDLVSDIIAAAPNTPSKSQLSAWL